MMQSISIASDFSRYPAGRYKSDGPNSGERFRDDILLPLIRAGKRFLVRLDGTLGYGSSFLEEAFGGLVRVHSIPPERIRQLATLESSDKSLILEIWKYIDEAGSASKEAVRKHAE